MKNLKSIYNRSSKINEWDFEIKNPIKRGNEFESLEISLSDLRLEKRVKKSALIAPLSFPDLKICCIEYSKEIITSNYHFLN